MKRGMALFMTIIFLLVMALVGSMIISFTSYASKHAARSYLDTQADLALRSATEYAILALQGHDFSQGKLNEIKISYPAFDADVKFHYFCKGCTSDENVSLIDTGDTNMSVLVYAVVKSKNPDFHIRKVRVTLQNP
ncbi:MAG: hypothetical protein ABGX23_02800 [Nautiliaceae bacterium]